MRWCISTFLSLLSLPILLSIVAPRVRGKSGEPYPADVFSRRELLFSGNVDAGNVRSDSFR